MGEYEIEYCPWCSGDVESTVERQGHAAFQARKCADCDTVFRVEVPHRETEINWTTAQ